ncbi:putative RNA-directed DNA polymerase [Helianthus annuus]|nr:putative RNA-directed DNA polymerase [Helianthus annuus]
MPEKPSLHPAYTVTNINNKIRTLDGKKVTYSAWVKLFNLHARAYKVLDHVDGTAAPAETDPLFTSWSEIDALILQWIYRTVSDDILARVLDTDLTARAAWLKIKEIFVNNKQGRAVTLETRFTNTTLNSCSSFDDYCQTLKEIAEQLRDVDQPVSDSRLVIQMVRGLPVEYDTIAAIINQNKPTWEVARSMIEDEQARIAARSNNNRDSVLLHSNIPPSSDVNRSPYPNGYRGRNYDPAKAARGRGARGGRTSGNNRNHPSQATRGTPSWNPSYPNTSYPPNHTHFGSPHPSPSSTQQPWTQPPSQFPPPNWTPPPTPYPSHPSPYPNQPTSSNNSSTSQAHLAHQPPPDLSQQPGNALCPSDIGVALSHMTLNYQDPQWHMDTGASSHITSDHGPQGWTPPFPPQ